MTPSFVPENFERIMGCTACELVSWLPRALPTATLTMDANAASCTAALPDGALKLSWSALPDARIALLTIPRLSVSFEYSALSPEMRYTVQRCFDLRTHRGGG